MSTFKGKVSERLSRMFADPPSSASSVVDDENPQARSYSKGGKSLSSYFSYIIPSAGIGGSRSYKHELSVPLSNVNFDSKDETLDTYEDCHSSGETGVTENGQENDDDHASIGSTSGSEVFEEATLQSSSDKQLAYLMDDSVFNLGDDAIA
ncbi:PREDICTED: uncharacterized protein LOC101301297 [Fragaria vesca subsp. vesca]|uniref:uncharacterized protein LOC101301297 n=1 Tax=Fragaria vesca subsp. vesca TaxID=101020 RepID=UPI0002C353DC|nr:PREDICTED: uncharacterized protein LOC101301297 [Fragaria vesca subsp. vesca]